MKKKNSPVPHVSFTSETPGIWNGVDMYGNPWVLKMEYSVWINGKRGIGNSVPEAWHNVHKAESS